MMRDKRRKTPGISLSAAGRHTPPCPGARRRRKSRDALLAQDRPAQRSKKSAVVERAFQPFVVVAGRGRNGICRCHRL